MLTIKIDKLYIKAKKLIECFKENNEFEYEIIDIDSEVGAGSLPTQNCHLKLLR